jgi:hypothetical protein
VSAVGIRGAAGDGSRDLRPGDLEGVAGAEIPPPTVRVHRFPVAVVPWHWLDLVEGDEGDAMGGVGRDGREEGEAEAGVGCTCGRVAAGGTGGGVPWYADGEGGCM